MAPGHRRPYGPRRFHMKNWLRSRSGDQKKKPAKGGRARDRSKEAEHGHTIDELIVLKRFDEAEGRLRERVKRSPRDMALVVKLAGVLASLERRSEAVEEYLHASDGFLQDGFFDKASAVLSRAERLDPLNDQVTARQRRLQRSRELAQTRELAVSALKKADQSRAGGGGTAAIELEQIWDRLSKSRIIDDLPREQLPRLLSNMSLVRFGEGDQVAVKGGESEQLLLICFGEIEAYIQAPGRDMALRTFSVGDIVGESALLERSPWPASYRALQPTSALRLDRDGLERVIVGNSDPRAMLQGLRRQGNDAAVLDTATKVTVA